MINQAIIVFLLTSSVYLIVKTFIAWSKYTAFKEDRAMLTDIYKRKTK